MKRFLEYLLIFFSLCLCVLIAFQWIRETKLHKDIQELHNNIADQKQRIVNLEADGRRKDAEIQRLDALKNDLNNTIKTNQAQIAALTKDLEKAEREHDRDEKQIEAYKDAFEKQKAIVQQQNEEITKQNADMKQLAQDRNQMVEKFNKLAVDYKELADRWNKQQEDLQKASTNAPPKK